MKVFCFWVMIFYSLVSIATTLQNNEEADGDINYRVQCWQQGIKIIDETNYLSNYQIGSSGIVSITFNNDNNKIMLVDINRTTCLIKEKK
jgi:hypothetical protein